jgi:PTH1 family peptidyl-tRNA hydrolase
MKLIIGLGNPGKQYEKTRHNVGWQVLDLLATKEKWNENAKAKTLYLKTEIGGIQVALLKPLTFMNNSGLTAAYAVKNHNLTAEDIFVVYDDIDLPLGTIRIGKFSSAAGHKGVQSIIDHLKTAGFIRFRVGIGTEKSKTIPSEKFVLQKFGLLEKKKINDSIIKTTQAIELALTEPLEKVMNEFN